MIPSFPYLSDGRGGRSLLTPDVVIKRNGEQNKNGGILGVGVGPGAWLWVVTALL